MTHAQDQITWFPERPAQNHKEQSWSVEAGLAHAAEYLRLPHYSHIGVYVQREHVLTLGND